MNQLIEQVKEDIQELKHIQEQIKAIPTLEKFIKNNKLNLMYQLLDQHWQTKIFVDYLFKADNRKKLVPLIESKHSSTKFHTEDYIMNNPYYLLSAVLPNAPWAKEIQDKWEDIEKNFHPT